MKKKQYCNGVITYPYKGQIPYKRAFIAKYKRRGKIDLPGNIIRARYKERARRGRQGGRGMQRSQGKVTKAIKAGMQLIKRLVKSDLEKI